MSRLFLHYIWRKAHAFPGTKYPNDRVRHLNSVRIPILPANDVDGIVCMRMYEAQMTEKGKQTNVEVERRALSWKQTDLR